MNGQIFLAGGGKEHTYPEVGETFFKGKKRILYIPLAWKKDDFDGCFSWFRSFTKEFGTFKIDMLVQATQPVDFEKYDGIFIGGGNTFKLLKRLREGRLDKKLLAYYNGGGSIYGGSAGAIIWGVDIKIAFRCSHKDVNAVKLKDTRGIRLVDADIQVHYEDRQACSHLAYAKKTRRKIIAIPEGSAVVVNDDGCKVIGRLAVALITSRSITKYRPGEKIST